MLVICRPRIVARTALPECGPTVLLPTDVFLAVLMVIVTAFVAVMLFVTVALTVMLMVTPVLTVLMPAMSGVVMPVAAVENLGNSH
jgi:hypothetical protein